jgi:hypothetical protein
MIIRAKFFRENFVSCEIFSRKYFSENIFSICKNFLSDQITIPPKKILSKNDCWRSLSHATAFLTTAKSFYLELLKRFLSREIYLPTAVIPV